jgi:hypothetical protein
MTKCLHVCHERLFAGSRARFTVSEQSALPAFCLNLLIFLAEEGFAHFRKNTPIVPLGDILCTHTLAMHALNQCAHVYPRIHFTLNQSDLLGCDRCILLCRKNQSKFGKHVYMKDPY